MSYYTSFLKKGEKNANVKLRNESANFLISSISFSLINSQFFLFEIKYYLETEIHDIFHESHLILSLLNCV